MTYRHIRLTGDLFKTLLMNLLDNALKSGATTVGLYGVLSALEKCCDACECAGDIMVTVRLKNS